MERRRFELVSGVSSKFWEIETNETSLTTRWGRIGTIGQSKTKEFADVGRADTEYARLVRTKLKEGYVEGSADRASTSDEPWFWRIIERSRSTADGDPEAQAEVLQGLLAQCSLDEIKAFQRHWDRKMEQACSWDLWGAAYVIGGGCSDDGFMDFRSWLISRGQRAFESALQDADSLARIVRDDDGECQVEELAYAAHNAWESRTADEFPRDPSGGDSSPTGEQWQEEGDDLKRRFPRLWKRFCSEADS